MNTANERETGLLRNFLHVIFKRKLEAFLFFLFTLSAVALGTFLVKPTYEASAQILVKIGRENMVLPVAENVPPVINFSGGEEQINSEIQILKAPSLAEEVIRSLGPTAIYPDLAGMSVASGKEAADHPSPQLLLETAAFRLEKNLDVERVEKSNVIEIRFRHKDPMIAAGVVNDLAKLFLDRHLVVHRTPQIYQFFLAQYQVSKSELQQSEEKLKDFMTGHNISSFSEEQKLLLNQQTGLQASANELQGQIVEIENRIPLLREQLSGTHPVVLQSEQSQHNELSINTLMSRLVELEAKQEQLLTKYNEDSRLVKDLRAEIQLVKRELDEQESKLFKTSVKAQNPIHQRLREDLLKNEAELAALKAKRETLLAQIDECQTRLQNLSNLEVGLSQLQNEVEVNRRNYALYQTKLEESRISDAMDREKIANVTLMESAQPPFKPVRPKVFLNLALGCFLGVFGGLGLSFLIEYFDESLERPEDVDRYLKLPVLGSIPQFKR